MGIFSALGLGLLIIVLKFLVPRLFASIEEALIAFFQTAINLFDHATTLAGTTPY